MPELEIVQVDLDHPDAQTLIARVQDFYVERYGGPDRDPTDASMFAPPAGAFFVGYADGVPVATGGWRRLGRAGQTTAEVKRMYVVPERTRQGLARQMLAHLESSAASAGVSDLVLATGERQPEAIALYLSSGYAAVEPFGYYAAGDLVRCFGKPLRIAQTAQAAFQPSTESAGRGPGPA